MNIIEEHEEHVKLILEALCEAGIYVSKKKSVLFTDEIHFLSHIISSHGIESNHVKIDKILAFCISHFAFDIKEFNELVNYIDLFISELSD